MEPLYRKAMIEMMEIDADPANGIRSFFKTPKENISDTLSLNLDIIRHNRIVSIDVANCTGGRFNKFDRMTNKEYYPPFYDEYAVLDACDMYQRAPGQDPYKKFDPLAYTKRLARNSKSLYQKIQRAEIKQAHDALFLGKITLIDGTVIDFSKKALHNKIPSVKWDQSTAVILSDIKTQILTIVKDSKRPVTTINMVCDPNLISHVLDDIATARIDYTDPQLMKRAEIVMPNDSNMDGMIFHGKFSIDGYVILLWGYDDRYEIPTGLGIANEGTETTYIPSGSCALFPTDIRLDMLYAGIAVNTFSTNSTLNQMFGLKNFNPQIIAGKFATYAIPDMTTMTSTLYGVRSAPLAVPTDIDRSATLSGCLT